MSLPVILTLATCLSWTFWRNSLKVIFVSCPPVQLDEYVQMSIPSTTRSTQNNKLLRVEFKLRLLNALLSRVSRQARGWRPETPRPQRGRRSIQFCRRDRQQAAAGRGRIVQFCDPPERPAVFSPARRAPVAGSDLRAAATGPPAVHRGRSRAPPIPKA